MSQVELLDELENQFVRQDADEIPLRPEMTPEAAAIWGAIDALQKKIHAEGRSNDRLARRVARLEADNAALKGVLAANASEQRDDERRFSERRNHLAVAGSWNDVERRIRQRRCPGDVGAEDAL